MAEAAKRRGISKKTRFEVFKRDSFTCQYCGSSSPDVVLHVDHIKPVSKGGTNRITNLITSCLSCNLGKSATELSDDSVMKKKKQQLDILQERKEQLELMMEWENGLLNLEEDKISQLADYWESLTRGFYLKEKGRDDLRKLIKKYSFEEMLKAIKIAAEQYFKMDDGDGYTHTSIEFAFKKIPGILRIGASGGFSEDLKKMYYIRGILRNRGYCNDHVCMQLMKKAKELNVDLLSVEKIAKECKHWSEWKQSLERYIEKYS